MALSSACSLARLSWPPTGSGISIPPELPPATGCSPRRDGGMGNGTGVRVI